MPDAARWHTHISAQPDPVPGIPPHRGTPREAARMENGILSIEGRRQPGPEERPEGYRRIEVSG